MQNDNNRVIKGLKHILADTYILYTKTQNFHWNVTGELFFMLHAAFEKQYEQLADAVDLIAERLRALNVYAPGTFQQFEQIGGIKMGNLIPSAEEMIRELLADHEHLSRELEDLIGISEEEGDQATMDMLIERQAEHQKNAWMLRSSLKD